MQETNQSLSVWVFITAIFSIIFGLTSYIIFSALPEFTKPLIYLGVFFLLISIVLAVGSMKKKEKGVLKYLAAVTLIGYIVYFIFVPEALS